MHLIPIFAFAHQLETDKLLLIIIFDFGYMYIY